MRKLFVVSVACFFVLTASAYAEDGWNFNSWTGNLGTQGLNGGHNPGQGIAQEISFDFSAVGAGEGFMGNQNSFSQTQGHGEPAQQVQGAENSSLMEMSRPEGSWGGWSGSSYTNQMGSQAVDPSCEVPVVSQETIQGSGTTVFGQGPGAISICNTNTFGQTQGVEGLAGMIQQGMTNSVTNINRPGCPPDPCPQ